MYRRMALIAGAIVAAVTLVVAAPALALGTLNQSISGTEQQQLDFHLRDSERWPNLQRQLKRAA